MMEKCLCKHWLAYVSLTAVAVTLMLSSGAFCTEFITNGGLVRALPGGSWCESNAAAFSSWTLLTGSTWYDADALKTNSMGCPGATTVTIAQSFAMPGSLPYTLSFRHNENQYPSPGVVVWSNGWARGTIYYYSDSGQVNLIGSDTTGNVTASERNTWTTATVSKATPANCVSAKAEIIAYSTLSGGTYGFTNLDDVSLTACIPAAVTNHPASQEKDIGQTATFSVTAVGESPLSYAWEKRAFGGSFAAIGGATSSSYTTAPLEVIDSGYQYRCKVTNPCSTVYSNPALLLVSLVVVSSIAEAKTYADGNTVRLPEKPVSARTSSAYWIQDTDQPSGIKINSPAYPAPGSRVAVTGILRSTAGERRVDPLDETWGTPGAEVRPYLMLTRSIGGSDLNLYSPGIPGSYGPNNIGLLVKIYGTVTNVGINYYYVDDGVGLKDGTTTNSDDNIGVRVMAPPGSLVTNDRITLTGISSVFLDGSQPLRALIPPGCTMPNSELPVGATAGTICEGQSTTITVGSTESDVTYQLRNSAGNVNVGGSVAGTDGTINLPTGVLTSTTTFNVRATRNVGGCSAQLSSTKTITVNPLPNAGLAVGATQYQIDVGQSTNVTVASSQSGVSYQLRKNSDNSNVGSPVAGTGGTINLPTGVLTPAGLYTFNVLATDSSTGCSRQLTQTVAITVGTLGTFTGKVRTARMLPISGATVTTSPPTMSATTGADGSYTLANVPAGRYDIIASKTGYQTHTWYYEDVTSGATVSVPDHLLPRSCSKIGAHVVMGSRTGWGAFLSTTQGCGKACQMVKMVDDFGAANDARSTSPETLTVGRCNDTPDYDLQGFDQYADPASPNYTPPAEFAQVIFDELTINHPSSYWTPNASRIDVWEICNEWSWWWAYQADFYIAMMDIAEAHGYRIAMYGCSGGNPPEAYWSEIARACRRAKAHGGHMLSLHEYAWEGTLCQELTDHPGDIVLRYRRLYDYLRSVDADCPLVLTECGNNGGGGFIGDEAFVADMACYDNKCREDDYVFGIASWTLGNWGGANWQTALPEMADYICAH